MNGKIAKGDRKPRKDSVGFIRQPAWASDPDEEDYPDPALEQVERGEVVIPENDLIEDLNGS